jgi:WD40 repeat protein
MPMGKRSRLSFELETLFSEGATGGLTDAQLLARFTAGRDEVAELAFVALVERHGPMVLPVCRSLLRDPHDAEDAFQATFLVLVKKARVLWVTLAFSPDNRLLAGYGTARVNDRFHSTLTIWERRSAAIVRSVDAGPAPSATEPGTLAFSPDSRYLASAGHAIQAGPIFVSGRFVGDGKKLVNHVRLWDVATGGLVWTSAPGDHGLLTSLVFSPDGESLFGCDNSATARIDAKTGQIRQNLLSTSER